MRGRLGHRLTAVLTSGLIAAALGMAMAPAAYATPGQVHDPVPIEPNQHFSGYVNGHPPGQAIIAVACAVGATTGHPLGHQKIEVEPSPVASTGTDAGFTGSAGHKIVASFGPSPAAADVIASFTSYYVPKNIPTSLTVPCSGTGTVVFQPLRTSKSAVAAVLPVTFGNVTG